MEDGDANNSDERVARGRDSGNVAEETVFTRKAKTKDENAGNRRTR